MGVFDDKKYEELDWISQATEPIESKLSELLSLLPEEVDIDYNLFVKSMGESYFNNTLSVSRVVSELLNKHAANRKFLSYQEENMLMGCFRFVVVDNAFIDFKTEKLHGKVLLKKIKNLFEEKDLEKLLGQMSLHEIGNTSMSDSASISRANEIMDLLGKCEDGLKTRSPYRKTRFIMNRVSAIFSTNEWKIKDTELADKVGRWIREYIEDGNLAAFSNFCRLKVMTHKGMPIYSMEEVK